MEKEILNAQGDTANAPRLSMVTGQEIKPPKSQGSITRFTSDIGTTIIVRREWDEFPDRPDEDVLTIFKALKGVEMQSIVEVLSSLEGMKRIEVVTADGVGGFWEF